MFTQHRKISRLHELLERHPQGLTIPEMAVALRLTSRSVRRYLGYLKAREADALESIPHGARGALRWRMNPRDRGRAMNLRRTQAYGLLATRMAFEPLRGSALYEELEIVTRQMKQIARRPVRAGGEADIASDTDLDERFVWLPDSGRSQPHKGGELDDLFRAVADLRVLSFRYVSAPRAAGDGDKQRGTLVTLHPYAMVLYRGEVHAIGRDLSSGRVEPFALSRMRESAPSEDRFEIPDDFKVSDFVHGPFGLGRATIPVVVEFSAAVADEVRLQRYNAAQRLATAPDGRLRVSVTVPSIEAALTWVLTWGSQARVVEPLELRDAVMRELKSAMQRYGR